MTLVFDLVLLAIVILFIVRGIKSGMIKAAFRPKRIYALLIAYLNYSRLGEWLCRRFVEPFVRVKVEDKVIEATGGSAANAEALTSSIPEFFYKIASLCNFDIDTAAESAMQNTENAIIEFVTSITMFIANFLSAILAGIILYILARIALVILEKIIEGIFKARILDSINKIGGAVFGVVAAYFFGLIAAYALGYGGAALGAGNIGLFSGFAIENTVIIRFFLRISPINLFI